METQTFILTGTDELAAVLHDYERKDGWMVRQIVHLPNPDVRVATRIVVVFEREANQES